MTICKDIASAIEKIAPLHLAEDWDNVGLLVGDENKPVSRVLIALDMDEYVAGEAAELGADLVLTHHPVMFDAVRRMTESDPQQRAIRCLIRHDICHYAAHTNLDVATGGLNDAMAERLSLSNNKVLAVTQEDGQGFGRYGTLEQPTTLGEMLERCKRVFGIEGIKYVGDTDRVIKTVAVNTGGGMGEIDRCYACGVDLFITGDIKYTPARSAYEHGLCLIDAGHYDSEIIVLDWYDAFLKKNFPQLEWICSKKNKKVLKTYC